MDEELEALAGAASLKVVCPICGQWLRLPENEPVEGPRVPPEVLKGMMSQSRLVEPGAGASRGRSPTKPWWRFW